MLKDLKGRAYVVEDVEAATGVDREKLTAWDNAEVVTSTAPPPPGEPVKYRLEHVYEVAILAAGEDHGLTPAQARRAMDKKLEPVAIKKEKEMSQDRGRFPAIWDGDLLMAICDLPEIRQPEADRPVCWKVTLTAEDPATVESVDSVDCATIGDPPGDRIRAIPITETIIRVNEVLEGRPLSNN